MKYRKLESADAVTLDVPGATATVIWLHGLGADGNDFVPIVPEITLPASAPTRFVFPHARVRPVTINNGYPMRAWYDIRSLSTHGRGDAAGTRRPTQAGSAALSAGGSRISRRVDRTSRRCRGFCRTTCAAIGQCSTVATRSTGCRNRQARLQATCQHPAGNCGAADPATIRGGDTIVLIALPGGAA